MRTSTTSALVALLLPILLQGQTQLVPVWSHTWPFGQEGPASTAPADLDNHVALDPVTGRIHVTVDDQEGSASPRWDFLFSFASDGEELTMVPAPLLGTAPPPELPGVNSDRTTDLAAYNGVLVHGRERSEGLGIGHGGSIGLLRANGSRWQLGLGPGGMTPTSNKVFADASGCISIRSLDGIDAAVYGMGPDGWLRWSRTYSDIAPFDDAVLMGNEVHASHHGIAYRMDRATGDLMDSYIIHGGDFATSLAVQGLDILFAYASSDGLVTWGRRSTSGVEVWTLAAEHEALIKELKVDAVGRTWLLLGLTNAAGGSLLIITSPEGVSLGTFSYGASMNDLALDAQQAYITGRLDNTSNTTYLIAVDLDLTTTVAEQAPEPALVLYPQPASTAVYIQQAGRVRSARVLSISGQVISTLGAPFDRVNVEHLPVGAYVLELTTELGRSTHPLVVAR